MNNYKSFVFIFILKILTFILMIIYLIIIIFTVYIVYLYYYNYLKNLFILINYLLQINKSLKLKYYCIVNNYKSINFKFWIIWLLPIIIKNDINMIFLALLKFDTIIFYFEYIIQINSISVRNFEKIIFLYFIFRKYWMLNKSLITKKMKLIYHIILI